MAEKKKKKEQTPILQTMFGELDKFLYDAVRRDDLIQALKDTGEALKAVEKRVLDTVGQNKELSAKDVSSLQTAINSNQQNLMSLIDRIKKDSDFALQTAINQLRGDINGVASLIPDLPDYTDDFNRLQRAINRVPKQFTAEQIRDLLEGLKGKERLDVTAIDGLEEMLKKAIPKAGGSGGIVGRDIFKDYDLSPSLDGVTKTFNIPAVWNIISVDTSSFPHALRKNIDYTWTPQTITFTAEIDAATVLAEGQTVVLTIVTG